MAMNTWLRPTSALACTGTTMEPRRLVTCTRSPSASRRRVHVLRVHLQAGLGHMAEQAAQRAGAAHAVPLVAQAAGGQAEGVARIARLGHGL
jgi:hypothetical protein